MRRLLPAAVLLTLLYSAARATAQDGSFTWLTDRAKAFAEARRTGKPIWVLFR